MLTISQADVAARLKRDNPWWTEAEPRVAEWHYAERTYLEPFVKLALDISIKRAAVLLGPRRVGKTVMIKQLIKQAIRDGYRGHSILYASIDTPIYSGLGLESFIGMIPQSGARSLVIFDEIQYLKDWERHLKDIVDGYPDIKFVVTGSAAAALRLKSQESGAGRFSEFMLPPLTFHEFLGFIGRDKELIEQISPTSFAARDISALNEAFVDYLNYGGYPEAVLNETIRKNPDQFVRNDIIDKVLLKDLPALYGISDIKELNKLFTFLAYNAGNEASLEGVSQASGLTKPTIKRYIEYLESAFLIIKIQNVDQNCRSLQRERNFKVYLNNPSMRAALFNPIEVENTQLIGKLAESAIFSQWQHSNYLRNLRYARWKNEEVDIVYLAGPAQKAEWAVEVKWSDQRAQDTRLLAPLQNLIAANPAIVNALVTSRTVTGDIQLGRLLVPVMPTALYCYTVGRNGSPKLETTDQPRLNFGR